MGGDSEEAIRLADPENPRVPLSTFPIGGLPGELAGPIGILDVTMSPGRLPIGNVERGTEGFSESTS